MESSLTSVERSGGTPAVASGCNSLIAAELPVAGQRPTGDLSVLKPTR